MIELLYKKWLQITFIKKLLKLFVLLRLKGLRCAAADAFTDEVESVLLIVIFVIDIICYRFQKHNPIIILLKAEKMSIPK